MPFFRGRGGAAVETSGKVADELRASRARHWLGRTATTTRAVTTRPTRGATTGGMAAPGPAGG